MDTEHGIYEKIRTGMTRMWKKDIRIYFYIINITILLFEHPKRKH